MPIPTITEAPIKRWPFVESPGEFTERLSKAIGLFYGDLLAAVRHVLIENPPVFAALRCESVSVTLTETDRSDLRVAANIIDRDGPSPIGVELSATLRRIASAGVAPSQEDRRG